MEVKFNVKGKDRKNLVTAISEITKAEVKYKGVPTCNYEVDYFTIDRFGTLSFDDRVDSNTIENLLEQLATKGFIAEPNETTEIEKVALETKPTENTTIEKQAPQSEGVGLTVAMPKTYFTGDSLSNLNNLLDAKGFLIKKALGIEKLPIEVNDEKISFPWFSQPFDTETTKAYTHLITSLCDMAKSQKRINSTEKEVTNEKYAFRCLILRLGFIGVEYKIERKILLKNLVGSSAFKEGANNEISE